MKLAQSNVSGNEETRALECSEKTGRDETVQCPARTRRASGKDRTCQALNARLTKGFTLKVLSVQNYRL